MARSVESTRTGRCALGLARGRPVIRDELSMKPLELPLDGSPQMFCPGRRLFPLQSAERRVGENALAGQLREDGRGARREAADVQLDQSPAQVAEVPPEIA